MPFRPEQSLLRVDLPALHTIDTRSVENLFGMWSVFSKASHAMEDGKRLENLSWRLWNRETFCCQSESHPSRERRRALHSCSLPVRPKADSGTSHDMPVPQLSTSATYSSSSDEDEVREKEDENEEDEDDLTDDDTDDESLHPTATDDALSRPELARHLHSTDSSAGPRERHITPTHLRNIVMSIQETSSLEPTDLPLPTLPSDYSQQNANQSRLAADENPETPSRTSEASTPHPSSSHATLLESSASTVDTNDSAKSSQIATSQDSSSTEMSGHSIVRGFVPGGAPSSYRSQTNLASQPTPILKNSPHYNATQPKKSKGPLFTIGTSSGEDESSLDSHMRVPSIPKSELSESLRRSTNNARGGLMMKKQTSFLDEVAVARAAPRHSPVFESDDEDEDDDDDDDGEVSESAIDDDDDSSEWEDSDDNNSGPCSVNERDLFQRVDSRPDLTSRRSLLTTLMHEPDRARALANAASRSTPALRRSRVTSPNGPSLVDSSDSSSDLQLAGQLHVPQPTQPAQQAPQQQQQQQQHHQGSQPKPIIMTTSNTHQQLALSPRTTRRNMLSTELTESLRKNLLWERQHKSTGNLAALKRRHTAHDIKNLKQHPETTYPTKNSCDARYNNDYFDAGLGEYHTKGW